MCGFSILPAVAAVMALHRVAVCVSPIHPSPLLIYPRTNAPSHHPHGTRRFLTMARADINCACLFGGAKRQHHHTHIHDTRCAVGGSRAQTHGLESATRPIDGGMALHRSQRRVRVQCEAQAGSGMSRAPINAPMTVQAPRECWRVSCRSVRESCAMWAPVVL